MRFTILRAAALVVLAGLQIPWLLQPIPVALKLVHVVLVGIAIARPAIACLILASLGPLTYWIVTAMGIPIAGTRLLEQMVLAVVSGTVVTHRPGETISRTAIPATIVGLVALTSAASVLPARLVGPNAGVVTWHEVLQLWGGQHYNPDPVFAPIVLAIYAVEGLALLWAVDTLVRRETSLAGRVILCLFVAHTAAAGLNLVDLAQRAARENSSFGMLLHYFTYAQTNVEYDHNALGAIFALVTLAAICFLAKPWWRLIVTSTAIVVLLAALWLTCSRTAAGVFLVVLAGAGILSTTRYRRAILVTAVIGFALVAWLYAVMYPRGRNESATVSIAGRTTMTKVAMRMTRTAPVFGIGLGTFYEQSMLFGAPYLENAHNNFLQLLSEEGVAGLAATIVLLAVILVPVVRAGVSPSERVRYWLLAGITAFLLTWLTGHPMLEPDAAFVFWLLLGVLAGLTPAPVRAAARTWRARAVLIASAVIAVSVPFRMVAENTRQAGVGLSSWRRDAGGHAYRQAHDEFSLYMPAGRMVVLPVRTSTIRGPVRIEVLRDGRPVDVLVANATWTEVAVRSPSRWGFQRIDFRVVRTPSGEAAGSIVDVGVPAIR